MIERPSPAFSLHVVGRLLLGLIGTLAVFAALAATATTTASASTFNYDGAVNSRVHVRGVTTVAAKTAVLGHARDGSAFPSVAARGASTTPSGSFIATEAAGSVADDAAGLTFRSDTSHIFRDAAGHLLEDTPANRSLIQSAIEPGGLRSTITLPDGASLAKYFRTLADGTQVWAEVRNGVEITNGGFNAIPR